MRYSGSHVKCVTAIGSEEKNMIELRNDRLEISFPEVHKDARMSIEFQRTLRIPDDDSTHYLPPGFGRFPLSHVDDFQETLPGKWTERGGVFLPMYQSEALWIDFYATNYPFAIKVAAGKINAVTGDSWDDGLAVKSQGDDVLQDYVVVPGQPWLDGFSVGKGEIRQFVAMPLGKGVTAEEQLTGEAEFGGMQIKAFPLKRELYQPPPPVEDTCDRQYHCLGIEAEKTLIGGFEMGLAPGGKMKQEIFKDEYGIEAWDTTCTSRCFVHIANSEQYRKITGTNPPTRPPTAKDYNDMGLSWFDYYDDELVPQAGSDKLNSLKSVGQMVEVSDVEGGHKPVVITSKLKKKFGDMGWWK